MKAHGGARNATFSLRSIAPLRALLKESPEWRIVEFRMRTHTAKQEAMRAIEQPPNDVSLDEIVYRLYVLD